MTAHLARAMILIGAAGGLPSPSVAAPQVHTILIDKMKFGAAPAGLKVGDTIIWDNRDMFRHTATASDGSFTIDLAPGAKGKIVLRHPGRIGFACKYHPGMRGILMVGQ